MQELVSTVRRRLMLRPSQTLHLLMNESVIVSPYATMDDVYQAEKDADGYLYAIYASEKSFGRPIPF